MSTYIHQKIYKEAYGSIPREPNGRIYEIHHIDGNHLNNDPKNLKAVPIQEHFDIHYSQQDWGACYLIALRMKLTPQELFELRSKASKQIQNERVKNGTHHFLGGELQRKNTKEKVKNGTHNFLGPTVQKNRIANGTHPFCDPDFRSNVQKQLLKEGRHLFKEPWICPHCGTNGIGIGNAKRWHFDKCKSLLNNP